MRVTVAAAVLAVLLAGCTVELVDDPPTQALVPIESVADADLTGTIDNLSDRLPANSTEFQPFLNVEDTVQLPGNGSMELLTGRGMHCAGDADGVAPGAVGWVSCSVRLVSDPTAMSEDVRALGIGRDVQRLTLRQASEPVEWRVVVLVENASAPEGAGLDVVHDSDWRPVDLSPVLGDPVVTVEMHDACDKSDAVEATRGSRGLAVLIVEFEASHGRPLIEVDLGPRSLTGDGESTPFAEHTTFEHGFLATYPTAGSTRLLRLELKVDLEAPESPAGAAGGPCQVPLGMETQEWTIGVGIVGADDALELKTRTVRVDVYLDGGP